LVFSAGASEFPGPSGSHRDPA